MTCSWAKAWPGRGLTFCTTTLHPISSHHFALSSHKYYENVYAQIRKKTCSAIREPGAHFGRLMAALSLRESDAADLLLTYDRINAHYLRRPRQTVGDRHATETLPRVGSVDSVSAS